MSLLPYASLTHRRKGYRATEDVVLIQSQTASDSATISFTSGINSTYGEYIFKFYNIHPETDNVNLTFQANATDSTSYDETITSTAWQSYNNEAGDDTNLNYNASDDQYQGTAFQIIAYGLGTDNDQNAAGELHLFNPASTTYVKHFYAETVVTRYQEGNPHNFFAGYFNTTTAIDDIQFKMSSGNFNGVIKLWGVK